MAVTKSNNTNITSPNGNSLAIFVDINDGKLKMKDINGVVQPLDDFVSVSGGTLQIEGGALINSTLQNVTDAENNVSQLQLATNATKINGNLEVASDLDVTGNTNIDGNTLILGTLEVDNTTKIKTANETYLDIEDGGGNNRFTIGKATGSQKVTLDYASNPTSSTEIVGSIRTYQNGTILSDIATFRRDGQVTFVERVNVEADSLVTTQTSSVIQSTTTNANMVIAPNGTGALIADIPDGAISGGNARGINAIDLQMTRANANQVAGADYSIVIGSNNRTLSPYAIAMGSGSTATGFFAIAIGQSCTTSDSGAVSIGTSNNAGGEYDTVSGGQSNIANGRWAIIGGGRSNNNGSQYGTISGGQSNTASTNTHATVVGGQSNTSSGTQSISGGLSSVASGANSLALGYKATASATGAISIASNDGGGTPQASGNWSNVFGGVNSTATNTYATALGGYRSVASGYASYALGYRSASYLYGQLSIGEFFSETGDAQQSILTARRGATLTTGATMVLSLDGTGTTNLIIPTGTNRMWKVKVEFIGTITLITGTATGLAVGNSVYGESNFGFKRVGGVSSMGAFIDDAQASDNAIMDTCSLAETAGASGELALTFTGPTFAGGGSVTMRVVAKVSLVEVAY